MVRLDPSVETIMRRVQNNNLFELFDHNGELEKHDFLKIWTIYQKGKLLNKSIEMTSWRIGDFADVLKRKFDNAIEEKASKQICEQYKSLKDFFSIRDWGVYLENDNFVDLEKTENGNWWIGQKNGNDIDG